VPANFLCLLELIATTAVCYQVFQEFLPLPCAFFHFQLFTDRLNPSYPKSPDFLTQIASPFQLKL
jgi:hypothetical protein